MNIEANSGLERRARLHAVLADPGRLRIVDELSLGDATPTDLQHALKMTSNLLAHHLRALEKVGLVSRRRSEADRRRSYLQLDPDSLAGLLPDAALPRLTAPRVVFVCTANTARSQLAAALWAQASSIPVASAGTHPAQAIAPGATAAARRHGLKLAEIKPRLLDDVLQPGDCVITVCDNAHEELARTGILAEKDSDGSQLHWSVPDPVPAGTGRAFDCAYDDLTRRVTHLAPRLAVS
jgi:ArsR family transcriptional regulator, arsenate/arsenite/antimonite-responsive transcriptional repressor / arsenate reductase (thioredoxin)